MNENENDQLADYDVLFQKFNEGVALLESDTATEYHDAVRLSAEIEELRAITEQVNAQSEGFQLVTVG
jgi:hypothetical protein